EKRVFLVILFTSFSGSLVSRISGAVQERVIAIQDGSPTQKKSPLSDSICIRYGAKAGLKHAI
ncbi:hypothetical protein P2P97_23005, partial [Escherichia coli]